MYYAHNSKLSSGSNQKRNYSSGGYILVLVIAMSITLSALAISMLSLASTKYAKTKEDINDTTVMYAAEAGVSDTVAQLNKNSRFAGFTTEKQFYSHSERGKVTYVTSVSEGDGDTLVITSTGSLYLTASDTVAHTKKTIRVSVAPSKEELQGNVLAGPGGLHVVNDFAGNIKTSIVNGDIYSKGKIRLVGDGASIGSHTNP